jgi:5'-3' exonuclease
MIQKLKTPVTVSLLYDHHSRTVVPQHVVFDGREYPIVRTGMHHTYREGRTLFHVFSVASNAIFFRLVLNTDTLAWILEEVADGESN